MVVASASLGTGAGGVEMWVHQRLSCHEASVVVLAADGMRLLA